MKQILLLTCSVLIPALLEAHPGTGIVIDSKGNIYYTDLRQVWKVEPSGRKTVAVPGVHTHELAIDKDDNIYGEHLWYNGERLNTWGHYVWKLHSSGTVERLKEPTPGFLEDYGFLRDSLGNVYWIHRFTTSRFMKRTPGGAVSTIASGKFSDIRWSYCTRAGVIYFVDLHKLYRLDQHGRFTLLAENLDDGRPGLGFSRRHNVYGIWADKNENIYVAILSQKKVKRVTPEGKVEVIAYSKGVWSPTGGAFDKKGNLWLLENSATNQVRIRQIAAKDLGPKPNVVRTSLGNTLIIGGAAVLLGLVAAGIRKLSVISL
ncbi:MAG TPA: hypothetical protein VEB63_01960 [Chitinophagaceae bacterium]|nr:hypothetical protein [Chitinophagaceae bacterium]